MEDCKGLFGKLFGHNFTDIGNSTSKIPSGFKGENFDIEAIQAIKSRTYEYLFSQCTRCGLKINQKEVK